MKYLQVIARGGMPVTDGLVKGERKINKTVRQAGRVLSLVGCTIIWLMASLSAYRSTISTNVTLEGSHESV